VRLLLDTHILLWALDTPAHLPSVGCERLESPITVVYFSAVSIWEIAIKADLGKVSFRYAPDEIAEGARVTGFMELPVYSEHAAQVFRLPAHHNDPFDRLLVAQALVLPARLVTADASLLPYSELVEWVSRN
jgi:PIN domain nuclease of toxin-antitoxin system